jgi:hypothetical protein
MKSSYIKLIASVGSLKRTKTSFETNQQLKHKTLETMKEHIKTKRETPCPKAIEPPANEASRAHNCGPTNPMTCLMGRNILKGSVRSSSKVLLALAVAGALVLGREQASASISLPTSTFNYDASIPFGTTTIHVNGTVTNINEFATLPEVTINNRSGTTFFGPIDLTPGAGGDFSGTFTVPVGFGPFTNILYVQAGSFSDNFKSYTFVTTVTPPLTLTESCDASIPFGTTTIHVNGTVTSVGTEPLSGVTVVGSDGTTLLGPFDLAVGASSNYNGTITVPVGCGPFTNTVTLTATAVEGSIVSPACVTTVTVSCPTDITVCNDPGQCGAVVTYPTGGCGTPTYTPPSGSFFPVGTTTVTSSECTFTVTVNACDNRCPLGPGFWKSHPSVWPVNSLKLGNATYTENQLLAILSPPPGTGRMADASLILTDQLIATKLNLLNGSLTCPIASTIAAADALIFNLPIPGKISPSSNAGQQLIALAAALANYNNGLLTPGCTP